MRDCTPTGCTGNCRQGRDCEASRRATEESVGTAIWLVIATSLVVIVAQVSSAIAGYLPKFHF